MLTFVASRKFFGFPYRVDVVLLYWNLGWLVYVLLEQFPLVADFYFFSQIEWKVHKLIVLSSYWVVPLVEGCYYLFMLFICCNGHFSIQSFTFSLNPVVAGYYYFFMLFICCNGHFSIGLFTLFLNSTILFHAVNFILCC